MFDEDERQEKRTRSNQPREPLLYTREGALDQSEACAGEGPSATIIKQTDNPISHQIQQIPSGVATSAQRMRKQQGPLPHPFLREHLLRRVGTWVSVLRKSQGYDISDLLWEEPFPSS